MVERETGLYQRPEWVRRLIACGDAAGGAEQLLPFDVDAMCSSAIATTGLDDFGSDLDRGLDGDWLVRLRSLVDAIDDTARMHAVGRLMTKTELLRCLRTRLWLAADAARRPGITSEVIAAPLVVTGPARSGTSLLLELLDLDRTLRGARGWEIAHPGPAEERDRAEALRLAETEYELWVDVQPEFAAVHDMRAHYPQECIHLQMPSFSGAYWPMVADIPGWTPDMVAAMQFHQRVLQSLQHGTADKTWVLKTPVYLPMLPLVFAFYADAWVVHTHRDPVKTVTSGASTLAAVRWLRSDHVETRGIAGDDGVGAILLQLMQQRIDGELPDRIVDVHFRDLVDDPVGAVERTYATMGRELTGAHADAIRAYVEQRPQGALGKHAYRAEQFGIDEAAVRERMRPYTDHYGIALETSFAAS
jgi:hypothetical protein